MSKLIKFICLVFSVLLLSCENQQLRKEVLSNDLRIIWYDKFLTSNNHSVIEFIKGKEKDLIFESNSEHITDVFIKEGNVIIKWRGDTTDLMYRFKKQSFGYNVIVDMSATTNDWYKVYQPEYYNKFSDSANGDILKK